MIHASMTAMVAAPPISRAAVISAAWIVTGLLLAGCVDVPAGGPDAAADLPATPEASPAADSAGPPCANVPCNAGYWCSGGKCLLKQGPCKTDDTCINDTLCVGGTCLPFGPATKRHDPACAAGVVPFSAGALRAPTIRCSYTKGDVIMTPTVADLDGDGLPEIIFINAESGGLVAMDGASCTVLFDVSAGMASRSQLAVADLTGDGIPEIVGVSSASKVVVYSAKGALLATAAAATQTGPTKYIDGGPAVADLDGKVPPEIVYAAMVLRYSQGKLDVLYNHLTDGGFWGALSLVADVDLDGAPEVVTGNRILDGISGKDQTPAAVKSWPGGYPAVGQFDKTTPEPEIVLISSQGATKGTIRIFHPVTGKVVFGPYSFGTFWGGPPTVADFDGDGRPEVGVAGYDGYYLFDPDCAAQHPPAECLGQGIRWKRGTKDVSSGSTGSSVFDFNGDGRPEVIYRDECWLRIYDGLTGKVRLATAAFSETLLDMPVVADMDADGHADLVLPSTIGTPYYCNAEADLKLPHVPLSKGLHVLQDPQNRWVSSRPLWNQHTYHVTNINDDYSVPLKEPHGWASHNNYRQNVQGKGHDKVIPAPDLTASEVQVTGPSPDCGAQWRLRARVCNRGAARAVPGVAGTFFSGDPRTGGKVICSAETKTELAPGKCEELSCLYLKPPNGKVDLWFAADNPAASPGWVDECLEKNNLLHIPGAFCPGVG